MTYLTEVGQYQTMYVVVDFKRTYHNVYPRKKCASVLFHLFAHFKLATLFYNLEFLTSLL